jgi:dihydrodipicolinate synthase/N-acetylneuraminate lyase
MTLRERLFEGLVIPAHPLALDANRKLDERHQRALTRYYLDAGAGGIAVGVHTTQFEIREPRYGLFQPVLELAAEEMHGWSALKVAGICGPTAQAVAEAGLARSLGYDAGLLSLAALPVALIDELLTHTRAVAGVIPVIGFYLQPAVGGRALSFDFWRRFVEIENVVAVKIAPFNRYQTLDVVRAVALSGRSNEVALYTGNDDNIVVDLLTSLSVGGDPVRIRGGLLGHWAVWTRKAVEILARVRKQADSAAGIDPELLTHAAQVTDANAALFDAANHFHGCIAGIHEILRRQGLLEGRWCLNPSEDLSAGQMEEIDRVCALYPHLRDDEFVAANLDRWLR